MFTSPGENFSEKVKSDKKGIVSVFFFSKNIISKESLTVTEGKMMTNNGR